MYYVLCIMYQIKSSQVKSSQVKPSPFGSRDAQGESWGVCEGVCERENGVV
jgi:hypothetical protein